MYDKDDFIMVFGYPIDELVNIEIFEKKECQHIEKLKITNQEKEQIVSGDLGIRRYFDNLRSSAFKIAIKYRKEKDKKVPDAIFIRGAGFGHGTGMCQEGAISMADEGFNYREILKHYYKDIDIKKVY
jgi:SpoIID/LytB domain protein